VEEGEALRARLATLERLTKREVCNAVARRRPVANDAIEQVGYPLGQGMTTRRSTDSRRPNGSLPPPVGLPDRRGRYV
jgi:hypothetical protein